MGSEAAEDHATALQQRGERLVFDPRDQSRHLSPGAFKEKLKRQRPGQDAKAFVCAPLHHAGRV